MLEHIPCYWEDKQMTEGKGQTKGHLFHMQMSGWKKYYYGKMCASSWALVTFQLYSYNKSQF